jgi:general secretion pathway protein D
MMKRKHLSTVIAYSLIACLGSSVKAEAPNPFGTGDAPPPEGGFFREEDLERDNNLGSAGIPPAEELAPPPLNAPPLTEPTSPRRSAITPVQRPVAPRNADVTPNRPKAPSPLSPPLSTGSSTAAKGSKSGKTAPSKLADYLQLDSTVKGLEVKNFDLPDKEIKDVVTLISKWTGKNFILDSKVRGKITIMGPSQVTLEEAYQAFLSSLEANGLTTVKSGKFIRIIESAEARRAPVETFAGDYTPDTDQFITRIFQLKYINADEVQREFRDLTTRQGKLFAYEPTNSIIITDTGSNIKRIQGILDTLDVKGFETTLHVLRIKNTSSKSIADMLAEIYGDDRSGGSNRPRTFRRSALERTRGGGIISKIIPDEQTNSLLVLANRAGFDQLIQLVRKLDVRVTDTGRIHVYYCEYAKAEDLASTLASLTGGGGAGLGKPTNRRASVSSPTAVGGAPQNNAAPARSGPVTAELDGGAKITSDSSTNSLVITANSGDYQTIKRVIKKLDIPRLQVFVETAILEINVERETNYGSNLGASAPGRIFAGGFIGDPNSLQNLLTNGLPSPGVTIPIVSTTPITNQLTVGGATQAVTTYSFMGLLRLLTSKTNSSVLSTPQIIALDNEKAVFKVLDETPVQSTFVAAVGGAGVGGIGGAGQGTIEYKKTGIEINLTPHVNAASKNIRLEIEQKVDSIRNAGVPQALQGVQIATTSRETNTTVVVKDQDFVMLGGLMSDRVDETVRKVPLLGDIPILGWLFKAKDFKTVKSNLVILLRPRIIGTSVSAAQMIDDQFTKRDEFIEENLGGDDAHQTRVKEVRDAVKKQKDTSANDPFEKYRNNREEEEESEPDDSDEPKVKTGLKSDPKKGEPVNRAAEKLEDTVNQKASESAELTPVEPMDSPSAPVMPMDAPEMSGE